MCTMGNYVPFKQFEGFKVVTEIKGKFYSPATGIQYKVGPMPHPARIGKHADKSFFADVINGDGYTFNHKKRTAVFTTKEGAENFKDHLGHGTIIKITVSGRLRIGEYYGYTVISGKAIDKIEKS